MERNDGESERRLCEGKNEEMERKRRQGVNPRKPIVHIYFQPSENGHAADALRDSAGELVAEEVPAAVSRRRRE